MAIRPEVSRRSRRKVCSAPIATAPLAADGQAVGIIFVAIAGHSLDYVNNYCELYGNFLGGSRECEMNNLAEN